MTNKKKNRIIKEAGMLYWLSFGEPDAMEKAFKYLSKNLGWRK